MRRILLFLLLMVWSISLWAAIPVKVTMRNHGYTMGDFVHMRVQFALPPQHKLDIDSLPLPGRMAPWLDLCDLKVGTAKQMITLDLTWQLFGTVEYSQTLELPEIEIKTLGKNPQAIVIPQQLLYYAAVLPKNVADEKARPDLPPMRFDTHTPAILAFVCLLLAMICAFAWLWLHDHLPWWPYRPGPLTTLARTCRERDGEKALGRNELQVAHYALNQSAGQSLYPGTLAQLFVSSTYLRDFESQITVFFNASWLAMHTTPNRDVDAKLLLSWLPQAAMAERLYRRQNRA